jgi:hypothetical protein
MSTPPAKTLSSISVTPATASFLVGATLQFTATAKYSDGTTANVSAQASWQTASQATATVNSTGLAMGMSAGSTTVSATLSGVRGSSTVSVDAKSVTSISVSPSTASIYLDATQQFSATAQYNDGSSGDVTATAAWAVTTQTVASVSASGLATGVAAGSTSVTATLTGVSGIASLTVNVKPVTAIAVTPTTVSIYATDTQQFSATATYIDGSTADVTSTATWASATSSIATVSLGGLATGVAAGTTTISATLSGIAGSAALTVKTKTATSIAVSPSSVSIYSGTTKQFNAIATYNDGTTATVTSTATWTSSDTTVSTINASGLAVGVAAGSSTVTATLGTLKGTAALSVVPANNVSGANIPLWHFDAQRSGLNAGEFTLTTTNVSAPTFGKLFSYLVDGYVYGQPLLVSNVAINSGAHNVLYVATEYDSVYAFDADSYGTGAPLWKVSLLNPALGETPLTGSPIKPFTGITSTPAIDLTTNTMYVVSTQSSTAGGSTFRLNALDITSGAQKSGSPVTISASVAGTNATTLNTACLQRAALLVANGSVFIGFGGCHSGWLLAYDEQTLAQTGVFNSSPNLPGEGPYASAGGVWMGGAGPATDGLGNIYVSTGNGPYDGMTAFGDSVIKFSPTLQMLDHFTPDDYAYMNCNDADLAAGGLLLISGPSGMQALAGGKTGKLYLTNTSNLGGEQANDAGAAQTLWFESDLSTPYSQSCTDTSGTWTTDVNSYEIFGTAAYFNGSVYLGVTPTGTNVPTGMRQFTYSGGQLTPASYTTNSIINEGSYGTTPVISANGAANGILWMIDHGQPLQTGTTQTNAVLRAYDASNLGNGELYDSSENSADVPGYGIKFTSPMVANGKVYITTGHDDITVSNPQGEIDVYGLKP